MAMLSGLAPLFAGLMGKMAGQAQPAPRPMTPVMGAQINPMANQPMPILRATPSLGAAMGQAMTKMPTQAKAYGARRKFGGAL